MKRNIRNRDEETEEMERKLGMNEMRISCQMDEEKDGGW